MFFSIVPESWYSLPTCIGVARMTKPLYSSPGPASAAGASPPPPPPNKFFQKDMGISSVFVAEHSDPSSEGQRRRQSRRPTQSASTGWKQPSACLRHLLMHG